jgi:Family of unknown function (DUF6174)
MDLAAGPRQGLSPRLVVALVFGFLFLGLAAAAIRVALRTEPTNKLTRENFDRAMAAWESRGPAGYNMDLNFTGRQTTQIHVEVRAGKVTLATENEVPIAQPSTWERWSVPRLLKEVEESLVIEEDPNRNFDVPQHVRVRLWAEFDEEYGYPRLYKFEAKTTPRNYAWEVTRFEVVP